MTGPRDLAAYLAGRWRVQRALRDGDVRGSFAGIAEFRADATGRGLVWDEDGDVDLGPLRGRAHRRLLIAPTGGGWEVRFDDGRLFHPLDLARSPCVVTHDCGRDRYEGCYRVVAAGVFDVAWSVRGPAKDQEHRSRYVRLGPAAR